MASMDMRVAFSRSAAEASRSRLNSSCLNTTSWNKVLATTGKYGM